MRIAALLALLAALSLVPQPASAATGLRVSGTRILEADGSPFVMRGTNHAHTWYTSRTSSFAAIKAAGANTVRVVLSGGRWTPNTADDVAGVITLCKQNRLICVLENHDTTGYGEQSGAYTLDQAVTYWIGLKSVLAGQENHVVVNIGNEPFGNNAVTPGWTQATSAAVARLREAGFEHLIMVDAPNWGQDWQGVMRDNAATVLAADPRRNVVFSVHMYGVYDTAAEITAYLDAFRTAGLPLVIGEFGHLHSDGDPDEDTILAQAQSRGLGYLGWSWSGNGGGVEYLDQVTSFDPARLTPWGERLFNGPDGVRATAREAAVYGGSGDTGCAVTGTVQSQWGTGYVVQPVTVTNVGDSVATGWTVTFTLPAGHTVTGSWNAAVSVSGQTVTAGNLAYNGRLAPGAATTFGFQAGRPGGDTATPAGYTCMTAP